MRSVIVLVSVAALVVLGSVCFMTRMQPVSHDGSPTFQMLLSEAIARLEGVPEQITAASVAEAHAEAAVEMTMFGYETCTHPGCLEFTFEETTPTCYVDDPTCDDKITCMRFYTCDSYFTCHGEETCDGCETCWNSTCDRPEMTCDCSETCDETDPDCTPYTFEGHYTCDGQLTCYVGQTCAGWPECGLNPSGTDRTTWGEIKMEFSE